LKRPVNPQKRTWAIIALSLDVVQERYEEAFDENRVGIMKSLSAIGDKFCDNAVVFSSAGFRAVFAEVVHFSADTDESPIGRFVFAVFRKLFSFVEHGNFGEIKCQRVMTAISTLMPLHA